MVFNGIQTVLQYFDITIALINRKTLCKLYKPLILAFDPLIFYKKNILKLINEKLISNIIFN